MSQSELAERAGISRGMLANLESAAGEKPRIQAMPSFTVLVRLALTLGVPPAQLLFPDLPHGAVEVAPGIRVRSIEAAMWLVGEYWIFPEWADGPEEEAKPLPDRFDILRASRMLRELDTELRSLRVKAISRISRDPDSGDEATRLYQEAVADTEMKRAKLAEVIRKHGGTVADQSRTELPRWAYKGRTDG